VPTGVKILNWIATMWGGKLRFTTPMLFSIGLVTMFTIGGLSGVSHAVAPSDTQQTDTYYIVAHFHYVLFGGALFGFIGGFYYWWPKAFGHMLREGLGKAHFWVMLVGFNLTFGPMNILGLEGMPRRTHSYFDGYGFNVWNLVSTIGAFLIAASFLIFFTNIFVSYRDTKKPGWVSPGPDPWDARSLEWMTASPAPKHNFDHVPVVTHRDEFWYRKYGETEDHRIVRIAAAEGMAPRRVVD
jgi:cytochrome c oxidase subunit 1